MPKFQNIQLRDNVDMLLIFHQDVLIQNIFMTITLTQTYRIIISRNCLVYVGESKAMDFLL